MAAVQREEACAEDKLRRDGGETPGKDEGPVGALQHKVLRALPEPTPQFDFGLFIVRAAAMSKHVDDIFPLLEDEEVSSFLRGMTTQHLGVGNGFYVFLLLVLKAYWRPNVCHIMQLMERSVVLEKYLGPPKEGAKRRGDHFMLDKLVADIPNVRPQAYARRQKLFSDQELSYTVVGFYVQFMLNSPCVPCFVAARGGIQAVPGYQRGSVVHRAGFRRWEGIAQEGGAASAN